MAILRANGTDGWRDLPEVVMPVPTRAERRRDEQRQELSRVAVYNRWSQLSYEDELEWRREEARRRETVDFRSLDEIEPRREPKSIHAQVPSRSIPKPRAPLKKPDGYQPALIRTGRHVFRDTGWSRIDKRDR